MLSFSLIISNKYFLKFHSARKTRTFHHILQLYRTITRSHLCTFGPFSVTTIHQRLVLITIITFITELDLAVVRRRVHLVSLCRGCDTKSAASGIGNHHILDRGHFRLQPGQFRLEMDVFLGLLADDDRSRN